jgi:signal transduction histidine kinase
MSGLNEAQKYEKAVESCPWIEKLNSAENLVILTRSDDLVSTVHGPMTSAEIFAHDFTTHLSGRWIREPSPSLRIWLLGLLVLLHVLGSTYLILQYPVLTSAGGLLIAGTFIHLILFQALFVGLDLYLPSANAILSIFVTYLIFSGYRLAIQENREWRGLKQAQYLKELDEMKTNFLSLVSHDLKTPIAKIQAVVERLRRDLQESSATIETRKDAIESLENSTKELRDYIQSVLSLSRIEAKGVILNLKSHDINRVAESVVRRLKPLAAQRKVRFVLELEPLFPVECDEDLIRQVLTNLVDNAIKVSPEGGVITLRSFEEEHQLVLEVVDQGPGISKDQLPLMFQKFHRFKGRKISSHSPRSSIRGSGLGLYLSKYFIELHKGKISLHSQLGVGTCFRMSLPLESLHPQPQETQPTRPERNPEL